MSRHTPCEACKYNTCSGCCRNNCREGGRFEAWEPIEQKEELRPSTAETVLKWSSIVLCFLAYPLVIYKLYEWVKYLIG